ncbi:GNAT family N-acetyltransferase [uncultured Robinsoniella sp.]|uniref:GNAT family N-acetyltransferase n=1 Tax=uncultured Robinsoniella sp. TaxID=904190 RepID=UPI00374F18AA
MEVKIKQLERKDFSKVIDFAIKGMHFERYVDNELALRLYGRYFLYLELERATQVIAAYVGDKLVGVLMADIKNKVRQCSSFWRKFYIKIFKTIMVILARGKADIYDETNKAMLDEYLKRANPDGEICFLAADPTIHGKGIGTLLLKELNKREKGKLIYLYTDNNCTYQFYEKKGFKRSEEKEIKMELGGKSILLTCLLYSKQL